MEILLHNGLIRSFDEKNSTYDWMLIKEGKINALGNKSSLKTVLDKCEEVIDLKGQTVYPGFFDAHIHLVQTAINHLSLDLSSCKSIDEIQRRVKTFIKDKNVDDMTIVYGYGLDETKLIEKRLPNRKELDDCSREHAIWLNRIEFHTLVVNSRVLHMCSIPFTLKGIEREESGLPTGRFSSEAAAWIRHYMFGKLSNDFREKGVKEVVDKLITKGITSVCCMEGGYMFHDLDAEFIYEHQHAYPIDMYLYYQTLDVHKVVKMGLDRIGGCIFLDGSFGSHTAAVSGGYADKANTTGKLYFDQASLNEFVEEAHYNKLQVAVHAIGDMAIEQILTAYEEASKKYPYINISHRIEHFELPTEDQIDRAKKLNVVLSVQPAYDYHWGQDGGMYVYRLGETLRNQSNPFKTYFEKDLVVAGGSDSDVTPCDPILGIYSAVNHSVESQRVSIEQAVRMFTVNAAKSVNDFNNKGSLEVGKLADFIVLDKDILLVEASKIKETKVLSTYKEGIQLYNCKAGDLGD